MEHYWHCEYCRCGEEMKNRVFWDIAWKFMREKAILRGKNERLIARF